MDSDCARQKYKEIQEMSKRGIREFKPFKHVNAFVNPRAENKTQILFSAYTAGLIRNLFSCPAKRFLLSALVSMKMKPLSGSSANLNRSFPNSRIYSGL